MATKKQDINALLNLSDATVSRMSEKELRKAVSVLSSAANKRVQRLRGQSMASPALQAVERRAFETSSGGKFGTRGKNLNQLRAEYSAIKSFYEKKTSSVSSWKSYRRKVYDKIGGVPTNESEFWKAYRIIEETTPAAVLNYGSDEVQKRLIAEMEEKGVGDAVRDIIDLIESGVEYDGEDEFFEI